VGTAAHVQVQLVDVNGVRCASGGASRPTLRAAPGMPPLIDLRVASSESGAGGTGLFELSYVPTRAGRLILELLVDGEQVAQSPFTVTVVAGPTAAAQSAAVGLATSLARAHEIAQFSIQARDGYGNRRTTGGDEFGARLLCVERQQQPSDAPELEAEIFDRGDGTYLGAYRPALAGAHELHVTLGGVHVRGSPFAVAVSDEAS
jgi:hypothetical protein